MNYYDFLNKTNLTALLNRLNNLYSSISKWDFESNSIKDAINKISMHFMFKRKNPKNQLLTLLSDAINYVYKKSIKIFVYMNKDVNIKESINLALNDKLLKNTIGLL